MNNLNLFMKNKELYNLSNQIKLLTLFRNLRLMPIVYNLMEIIDLIQIGESEYVLETYSNLCNAIYEEGGDLGLFLREYIRSGSNLYVEKLLDGAVSTEMEDALNQELDTIQKISKVTSKDVLDLIITINPEIEALKLPLWSNSRIAVKKEFETAIKNLNTKGYGIFAEGIMFKLRDGEIVPVKNADYQTVDKLYEYNRERELVLKNTEALANGKIASNVLLYGDAGTGKSTTVKAAAAYYAKKGIRLIEIDKTQVSQIPLVAESLANSPLKFIFFIDDLTFTKNDDDYYALKGILEGNVSGTAPNILIYATSNRRHLVKESMADREGDDLHLNDTLQETMSLSSRFGLTITFSKPAKDQYLSIVEKLAIEQGLLPKEKDILSRAEAFAIRANGRSPRTAKQFIVLAKNGLA